MTYAAALEEAIDCACARCVAMIVQRRLDLALEGPLNGLGQSPRSAVGESYDRHTHANGIALPNEESEWRTPHALRHVWGSTCAHTSVTNTSYVTNEVQAKASAGCSEYVHGGTRGNESAVGGGARVPPWLKLLTG